MSSGRSRSGGQRQRHDVQAIEQILAEPAGSHLVFEVAVRRGDQANIRLAFARLAEPFVGPIVEESQQPRLSVAPSGRRLHRASSVPPSASWTLPATSAIAPVNAPLR